MLTQQPQADNAEFTATAHSNPPPSSSRQVSFLSLIISSLFKLVRISNGVFLSSLYLLAREYCGIDGLLERHSGECFNASDRPDEFSDEMDLLDSEKLVPLAFLIQIGRFLPPAALLVICCARATHSSRLAQHRRHHSYQLPPPPPELVSILDGYFQLI